MPTGVRRLDDLLGGGLRERSTTLLYGPPFIGKEVLAKLWIMTGLQQKIPGILVLTDVSSFDMRRQLAEMDPRYAEYEKAGLIHFVDTYSKSIGASDTHPTTEYVDGLVNFNAVSLAVNNAERKIIGQHANHRVLFTSVSTLIAYTNGQTAFRFLQVLVGKTKAAGATNLLVLERGMHQDAEVEAIKHLTEGIIEFKSETGKNLLHVEGAGLTDNRGWVDYKFSDKTLDITGSFAAGRIR